jgi:MFS family permease
MFAVPLQVYDLTRSPVAVGAIGVAQMAPTLAAGPLAGPVTDATDRRKLVLVTSMCLAAVSAAFAGQAFAGLRLVWLLYVSVAVQSALVAVNGPARSAFIPALLPASQLSAASRPRSASAASSDRCCPGPSGTSRGGGWACSSPSPSGAGLSPGSRLLRACG